MIRKIVYLVFVVLGLIFSGCSATTEVKTKFVQEKRYNQQYNNNPREFRYKPVIGTKQSDTRVMIDMGEWAKIWVKNYRNKNETFVASHSIVTKVRAPGFIAGEQIPRGRRDAVADTYGGRSFTFRSSDLTYDNSSHGNEDVSDNQIKDYMNTYEYSKKTKKMAPQKRKDVLKYDGAIRDYMKKVKDEKIAKQKLREKKAKEYREAEKAKAIARANEKSDAQYDTEEEYKYGGLK